MSPLAENFVKEEKTKSVHSSKEKSTNSENSLINLFHRVDRRKLLKTNSSKKTEEKKEVINEKLIEMNNSHEYKILEKMFK